MTIPIIAVCVGVGVATLIAGVAMLIRSPEMDTVEDRLATLAGMARRPHADDHRRFRAGRAPGRSSRHDRSRLAEVFQPAAVPGTSPN